MIVFRDVREQLPGSRLQAELLNELHSIQSTASEVAFTADFESIATSALLRAGELECALIDLAEDNPDSRLCEEAERLAQVTDLLSQSLIAPAKAGVLAAQAQGIFQGVNCPENVRVSPPEGFCFYALHPLDYVELLNRIALPPSRPVLVVGIRSMGTTLSSVVLSALKSRNVPSERITVRPAGHPYDRVTRLSGPQHSIVSSYDQRSATFLVVDEGPGLSGSSFLSAADALYNLGISEERIVFLCSRYSDPDALVAKDAAQRWRRFNSYVVSPTRNKPSADAFPLSGGDWRPRVFSLPQYEKSAYRQAADWPAVWGQLSPAKYLSRDGKSIFKFEGLGRYGAAVRERADICAEGGFCVAPKMTQNGFTEYPWLEGKLLSANEVTQELLERMADYLAFRSREFHVAHADTGMLNEMTAFNFAMIADRELARRPELVVERPVVADARMMPYEWIKLDSGGRLLKLDCAAHGDNHFLPGPVDIAWDIAGAIVEWRLDGDSADYFLKCYERASGDRAGNRLQDYLLAYSAFQAGYSMMAVSALAGSDIEEEKRLLRDYEQYRCMVLKTEAERESQRVEVMSRTQRLPQPQSPVLQT